MKLVNIQCSLSFSSLRDAWFLWVRWFSNHTFYFSIPGFFFYSIGQYICNVFDFPYKTINFGKLDISYLCTDSQHIESNLNFNIYFTSHEFWKCWWKFKPIPQNEEKTCSNIVNIVDALSTLIHIFVVSKIMHKAFTQVPGL